MTERFSAVDQPADDVRAFLEASRPAGRNAPGTIRALAHRPPLLRTFLAWARVLAREGALTRRDHEILALRASYNCRSAFEWGEHREFALASGLREAEVTAIAQGADAPSWSVADAELVRVADQLHAGQDIDDATWASLAARYDEGQLVEIVYVVGQYTMLSMVANALRVDVPESFDALP